MKTKTVYVQCTFVIPVEVPDREDYNAEFHIEENGCPGTGIVQAAIAEIIEQQDNDGYCWACAHGGQNKIVEKPDYLK